MTDKKSRTIPEIQQEYQNLCLKAGHLQYQVYNHTRDLEMINSELRDLNLEAAAVQAAEAAKAKEEAKAGPKAEDNVVPFSPEQNQSGAV